MMGGGKQGQVASTEGTWQFAHQHVFFHNSLFVVWNIMCAQAGQVLWPLEVRRTSPPRSRFVQSYGQPLFYLPPSTLQLMAESRHSCALPVLPDDQVTSWMKDDGSSLGCSLLALTHISTSGCGTLGRYCRISADRRCRPSAAPVPAPLFTYALNHKTSPCCDVCHDSCDI